MELFGCLEDKLDDRDFLVEDILGATDIVVPEEFTIKIIDAKDQGAQKSTRVACTCYSTYHAAETMIEVALKQEINSDPIKGWELQGLLGTRSASGDYVRTALKSLVQNGLATDDGFHMFGGFATLGTGAVSGAVLKMKQALYSGTPIITSIRIYENTSAGIRNGTLPTPVGKLVTGHAVTIIGYSKEGWLILNSFGAKWGKYKNGTFWVLPYANTKLLESLFILYPNKTNMIFDDIYDSSPNAKEIKQMRDLGIMKGTLENRFEPDRPMTRREMAIVMSRVLEYLKNL
jgi:hypothetical protein